ncbi:MAG: hypothetical protein M1833_003757 [Piccolia ochrophora]|nr:MAG: hypothetical protein M1833_003757 [Piccolia ochrophora]
MKGPSLQDLPLAGTQGRHGSFPSTFFLDSEAFHYCKQTVAKGFLAVSQDIVDMLGDDHSIHKSVEQYFCTTHTWLPIVSKVRMKQRLSNPLKEPGADIALLFLTMKLVIQYPDAQLDMSQIELYTAAKRFYLLVETAGIFTVQLLQASVLLTVYEIGHAIYPAAYLSIAHSARVGHALGIHDRKGVPQMLNQPGTWTELEERGRLWWAILVLERYVNIGSEGRPLATEEPRDDWYLPVEDGKWDRGEMTFSERLFVSSPTNLHASSYARMCQAGHLLGRVLRHMNDRTLDLQFRVQEATQLHRATKALLALLPRDDPQQMDSTTHSAVALCYSTLLSLYDPYSCTETMGDITREHAEMQSQAILGLKSISKEVVGYAEQLSTTLTTWPWHLDRVSPLVTDGLYQAAAHYSWKVRESGNVNAVQALTSIRRVLKDINRRWHVAGEYERILAQQEVAFASYDS